MKINARVCFLWDDGRGGSKMIYGVLAALSKDGKSGFVVESVPVVNTKTLEARVRKVDHKVPIEDIREVAQTSEDTVAQ